MSIGARCGAEERPVARRVLIHGNGRVDVGLQRAKASEQRCDHVGHPATGLVLLEPALHWGAVVSGAATYSGALGPISES